MDIRHAAMWSVVSEAGQVIPAIENAPIWAREARSFAAIQSC